jgi:hypothetical protein
VCPCGKHGYIEKSFKLQEPGEVWEPYLRGAIPLGKPGNTYQPLVFLVSYRPTDSVTDVCFSYYKDLRPSGGRLKLGYGPGGPPVLGKDDLLKLLSHLTATQYLTKEEMVGAVSDQSRRATEPSSTKCAPSRRTLAGRPVARTCPVWPQLRGKTTPVPPGFLSPDGFTPIAL